MGRADRRGDPPDVVVPHPAPERLEVRPARGGVAAGDPLDHELAGELLEREAGERLLHPRPRLAVQTGRRPRRGPDLPATRAGRRGQQDEGSGERTDARERCACSPTGHRRPCPSSGRGARRRSRRAGGCASERAPRSRSAREARRPRRAGSPPSRSTPACTPVPPGSP